jgi:Na+-translocating ferredoxin:NAD+ oxidoreductase RnfG subunit
LALLRRVAAVTALLVAVPVTAAGQLTQDEALALAFPDAEWSRESAFLDDEQMERARTLAGGDVDIESMIVTHYVARRGGAPVGVAYFDAARVRTLPQVLMIVVGSEAQVLRVETVSFREPPEYRAPDRWLDLFDGRPLDDELSTKRAIPNITGATLTAAAVTRAVRRVLALHAVVAPLSGTH